MARSMVWVLAVLAGCISGSAGAPAVAARLRSPPQPPVLLVGEVHVGGSHAGVLGLYLDGKLHASIPAGNGVFELVLPADGDAGMVSLEFSAPGLRLRSLLGGQRRLSRGAGADARLGVDDEDGLRMSPLSTAVAVLASSVDGVPPRSDMALADAVQAAGPSDIVRAASAIERLAVDPSRLPKGFPDGLALAEDRAAFDQAVQADPGLVAQPQQVLDPLPVTALRAGDIGDVLIFTGPRAGPGVPPVGHGMVLEREADGFRLHDELFDGPAWIGGVDVQGSLALVPATPVARFAGYRSCPSRGVEVTAVMSIERRDFRRHWRGAGVSLWQSGMDGVVELLDCPGIEPVAVRTVELSAAPDMLRTRLLTTPRRFHGRHALPLFCGLPMPHGGLVLEPCGQADHVFARDGSGVLHPADAPVAAFSWAQDGHGAIRVDYGEASTRFWIIDPGGLDRTLQPVAYVAEGVVVGYPGTSSGQATRVRGGLADDDEDAAVGRPRERKASMPRRAAAGG